MAEELRRSSALGLDLRVGFDAPALPCCSTGGGGRDVIVMTREAPPHGWDPGAARMIGRLPAPPAPALATAEEHPQLGWRLWASDRGEFFVSSRGDRITCVPGKAEPALWQRFLIAQALPLAAVLRGLELLHASAVVVGGRAFAFVGASGAGKTTVALRLMLGGCGWLADDVVALESHGRGLLAHPGPAVMGVRHDVARRFGEVAAARIGPRVGENAKEVLFAVPREDRAVPLGGVYLLDRSGGERFAFEPVDDPRVLLSSVFCPLVLRAERLERALDVVARVHASVPLVRVRVPERMHAAGLAAELAERIVGEERRVA